MLSELTFYFFAALTLAAAVAAMSMRNLVRCALCAAAAFGGLAVIYVQLDAEFAGFVQFLVYVGAVAILIVFAVLLTRGEEIESGLAPVSSRWVGGFAAAAIVLAAIVGSVLSSPSLNHAAAPAASAPVKQIGRELMTGFVLPLETVGLLLTAALLGAVVIAMRDDAGAEPVIRIRTPLVKEEFDEALTK